MAKSKEKLKASSFGFSIPNSFNFSILGIFVRLIYAAVWQYSSSRFPNKRLSISSPFLGPFEVASEKSLSADTLFLLPKLSFD
jgi:hypothetical protein